jgi:tRNA pseudouridine13 synthase
MQINHWHYQYSKLNISGQLKSTAQDFQVTEILGYTPLGEGEHIYLWVEKIGLNTAYLAEQIAKFTGLPLRAVTYAGRKDKHALTQQWFSVHLPGKGEFNWNEFKPPGARILKAIRHNKKLRVGVLKGNHFTIKIRNLSAVDGIENRLKQISFEGVPNYYGAQRFGSTAYDVRGSNLVLAEKMILGESIRNRNKRSMAISALRSWLFNEMVHTRLLEDHLQSQLTGDVMQLAGSNSFFCTTDIDPDLEQRLQLRDVFVTAPLWGTGDLPSQNQCLVLEKGVAKKYPDVTSTLENLGLKQERRAIRLFPEDLQWTINADSLDLQFSLPSGTFATSVLREIIEVYQDNVAD